MSMSMVEAAKSLAETGREQIRKLDLFREMQKSRREERAAMDRRHEWQFLWSALQDQLGDLNPWKLDVVPDDFLGQSPWLFELKPFGIVPMTIKFQQMSDKLWNLQAISFPHTVRTGESLQFCDWDIVSPEALPIVLANMLAMEKRIAENTTENTSDHA